MRLLWNSSPPASCQEAAYACVDTRIRQRMSAYEEGIRPVWVLWLERIGKPSGACICTLVLVKLGSKRRMWYSSPHPLRCQYLHFSTSKAREQEAHAPHADELY
jgi:hypothetical protein